MISAREMSVGDEVELIVGKYAGVRGKIKNKQPRISIFAIRILVDIDLSGTPLKIRNVLNKKSKEWHDASDWKLVVSDG